MADKIKTHILILSQTFPKGHPSEGKPTNFGGYIVQTVKRHTLRENYADWEQKIAEVLDGKAILSVRVWSGTPYRSRQQEILRLDSNSGVGIQKLHSFDENYGYIIGQKGDVLPVSLQELANNDGLSLSDWKGWFTGTDHLPLAIIHFTPFRYE